MTEFEAEYQIYCDTYGAPERIELMLCDINAVLRGKWLPGDQVSKFAEGTVKLPLSTYAPNIMGYEVEETGLGSWVGDPDGIIVPVLGTLKPVPWATGNVAQVLVEMTDETGEISPLSPRSRLQKAVTRCNAAGFYPVVATELEFYIIKKREDTAGPPEAPEGSPGAQNYDLEVLSNSEEMLTEILEAARLQGIPTDTLIAEYGPGQFEVNFHHTDDVLSAADSALLFKRLVIGVVNNHDLEATFMAKPYAEEPGNGMHVHASILDAQGDNVFASLIEDEVSPNLKKAVAGVLDTMHDMQAIFSPHMNSFRRFQPNSFAPTAPDWGVDNRAAGVRLPEINGPAARLEHRIAGADVNPYLVLSAIVGGMLYGLQNDLYLPTPLDDENTGDAIPLSHDWRTAVERFEASQFAQDVFGADYHMIYTAIRMDEIKSLTAIITEVEYRYYLSRL
jgi:glutamine synthetase